MPLLSVSATRLLLQQELSADAPKLGEVHRAARTLLPHLPADSSAAAKKPSFPSKEEALPLSSPSQAFHSSLPPAWIAADSCPKASEAGFAPPASRFAAIRRRGYRGAVHSFGAQHHDCRADLLHPVRRPPLKRLPPRGLPRNPSARLQRTRTQPPASGKASSMRAAHRREQFVQQLHQRLPTASHQILQLQRTARELFLPTPAPLRELRPAHWLPQRSFPFPESPCCLRMPLIPFAFAVKRQWRPSRDPLPWFPALQQHPVSNL